MGRVDHSAPGPHIWEATRLPRVHDRCAGEYALSDGLTSQGTVIWMNFINNESEWLANKVVQGLFASPIEMLIEISIADMVGYGKAPGSFTNLSFTRMREASTLASTV